MNRSVPLTVGSAYGCENFRIWLKDIRTRHNESQGDLAIAIDVDRKSIVSYELGLRIPKLDAVFRIAEHYGLKEIRFSMEDRHG